MPSQERGDKAAVQEARRDESDAQQAREEKHLEVVVPPEAAIMPETKIDTTDRATVATERLRPDTTAPKRPYSEAMTDQQREALERHGMLPPDQTAKQKPQE